MSTEGYLILLWSLITWSKCDLITPRTFPDDIDLFPNGNAADLNLTQSDKPWMAYVTYLVNKLLEDCLLVFNKIPFPTMWR